MGPLLCGNTVLVVSNTSMSYLSRLQEEASAQLDLNANECDISGFKTEGLHDVLLSRLKANARSSNVLRVPDQRDRGNVYGLAESEKRR